MSSSSSEIKTPDTSIKIAELLGDENLANDEDFAAVNPDAFQKNGELLENSQDLLEQIKKNELTEPTLIIRNINDSQLARLASALAENKHITKLIIENVVSDSGEENKVSEETLIHLCECLKKNSSLIDIDLSAIDIPREKESEFVNALHENLGLRNIQIDIRKKFLNEFFIEKKQLVQGAAFILAEELFPKIKDEQIWERIRAEVDLPGMMSKALLGDISVSYQTLYQSLEKAQKCLDAASKTETHTLFKNSLIDAKNLVTIFKEILDEFANAYLGSGMNILHCAAGMEATDYISKLVSMGFSIHSRDNDGKTPLFCASALGKLESVKLLVNLGSPIAEVKDADGINALNEAKKYGKTSIVNFFKKTLFPDKKEETKEIASEEKKDNAEDMARRLRIIFGVKKLDHLTEGKQNIEGDYTYEGYKILLVYLERFKRLPSHSLASVEKINRIIENLKSAAIDDNPDNIKIEKTFLANYFHNKEDEKEKIDTLVDKLTRAPVGFRKIISCGFIGHTIGAVIEKNPSGKYLLSLADRGGLLELSHREGEKFASLKNLTFDAEQLETILQHIFKASVLPAEKAVSILDEELPRIAHSRYIDNPDISQSRFKAGICFFANPKSIIYDEFVNEFGAKKLSGNLGKKLYKDFTLFMREQVLSDYLAANNNIEDDLSKAAKAIVAGKKKKYSTEEKTEEAPLAEGKEMAPGKRE